MPDSAPPPIGHNLPPREKASGRVKELVAAANAWLAEVPVVTTEEEAAKLEDFLAQCRLEYAAVDGERKAEKTPLDRQVAEIQLFYNPLLDLLNASGGTLRRLKAAWLTLVEQRQKAEAQRLAEIARQAQEAAEVTAAMVETGAANTVEATVALTTATRRAEEATEQAARAALAKPQVVGELSGRASGFRHTWVAVITDAQKAAVHYCQHAKVLAAIQACANADAKAMRGSLAIPGVQAKQERSV